MLKQELLSIWKDKKFTLSIIVMVFMPILYSGMLLWAFWDPYSKLDKLPVALVNEDSGAILDGEQIALGDELIKSLIQDKQFDFFEVSSEEAKERLLNQEYYLLINIPENFSQHATTLLDDNPEKLEILYLPNEGYNFLSAKIGDTAIEKIRAAVNEEVAKTYTKTLFESIDKLGNGFAEAADGATSLKDGATEVVDGTHQLKDYLQQLATSTVTLADGTSTLAEGITKAQDGAKSLAEGAADLKSGTNELQAGAGDLAAGSEKLKQGVEDYTAGVDKVATNQQTIATNGAELQKGIEQVTNGTAAIATNSANLADGAKGVQQGITQLQQELETVIQTLPAAEQEKVKASLAQLQQASGSVASGASQLAEKSTELSQGSTSLQENGSKLLTGQQQLAEALSELSKQSEALRGGMTEVAEGQQTIAGHIASVNEGATKLNQGANELTEGLAEASNGTAELANGTSTLASKSGELAQGANELAEGTVSLADGAKELSNALTDASSESKLAYSDETVDMTVNPVTVNKEVVNGVDNYGSGFAPYFISLGLFVGALLLTNVYPYVQPVGHPTSIMRWYGSKTFVPFVVMIGQIVLIVCIVLFALGLQVDSIPLLILTTAVTSFSFMAIIQVLTVVLGDVGRFLGLLFLIVQLTSSAGTFPVELLPKFFQTIHEFMPMTYSIKAYRDVIAGDYTNFMSSLGLLTIVGIICVIISIAFFALLFKRRYSKQMA